MSRNRRQKKKSIIPIFFLSFVIIASLVAFFAFSWWQSAIEPVNPSTSDTVMVIVPKGFGTVAIANLLKNQNLIKNPLAFRLMVDRMGYSGQLQAGSFTLSSSQNLEDIIETLTTGTEDFWVTIPEGKRLEEVAEILNQEFQKQELSFSTAEFLESAKDIEGYLFPDTYLLPRNTTTTDVLRLLRNTFDSKIPDSAKIKASNLGLEFKDIVIIASLVEREAKFEVDRSKVAGVILNRLKIDMALQIDATVQYGLASATCQINNNCDWWPVLTETIYPSVYNTYQNPGLPPTAICNPGKGVIEAVLEPAQHNYLYYVSEPSGKTHYAETLDQHNQNIANYLNYE
jgi:peptidoglycan lytic transglycosylase G